MYGTMGHGDSKGTRYHPEKTLNHHIKGVGAQIRQQKQGHTQMGDGEPKKQYGNPFSPQQGFLFRTGGGRLWGRRMGKELLNSRLKGCPLLFRVIGGKFLQNPGGVFRSQIGDQSLHLLLSGAGAEVCAFFPVMPGVMQHPFHRAGCFRRIRL